MCTKEDYLKGHKASGIKVGDTVRVVRKADSCESGWFANWYPEMNRMIGREFKIVLDRDEQGFRVEYNYDTYLVPYFVLEKVTETQSVAETRSAEYDDNGVELLIGDVVDVWDYPNKEVPCYRIFKGKTINKKYLVRSDFGDRSDITYTHATFYARPPKKELYVKSRKEVAQILLDEGYVPFDNGSWIKGFGECYGYQLFKDCGNRLSECSCIWDKKFLVER